MYFKICHWLGHYISLPTTTAVATRGGMVSLPPFFCFCARYLKNRCSCDHQTWHRIVPRWFLQIHLDSLCFCGVHAFGYNTAESELICMNLEHAEYIVRGCPDRFQARSPQYRQLESRAKFYLFFVRYKQCTVGFPRNLFTVFNSGLLLAMTGHPGSCWLLFSIKCIGCLEYRQNWLTVIR